MGKVIYKMITGFSSVASVYPQSDRLEKIKSPTAAQSAMEALEDDWKQIGSDLYRSIEKYEDTRKRA